MRGHDVGVGRRARQSGDDEVRRSQVDHLQGTIVDLGAVCVAAGVLDASLAGTGYQRYVARDDDPDEDPLHSFWKTRSRIVKVDTVAAFLSLQGIAKRTGYSI